MLIRSIDSQNKCIGINWRETVDNWKIGRHELCNLFYWFIAIYSLWETVAMESATCDLYAIR